jgi:hypothetical protein
LSRQNLPLAQFAIVRTFITQCGGIVNSSADFNLKHNHVNTKASLRAFSSPHLHPIQSQAKVMLSVLVSLPSPYQQEKRAEVIVRQKPGF